MFQFATATQIVFGAGALAELPRLVHGIGTRAFHVLGDTERYRERAEQLLGSAGVSVSVGRVRGEPTVEDALQLVGAARAAGSEFVVGLGGGSVVDAAKALAALLANPGDPLEFLEVIGKGRPLEKASLPFIAVPTTAGTGAEVTKNAVLASTAHGVKVSLRSDSMLPRVALVDPELTLSLPRALTAATGLDALTQVLEPFVSCKANPLTDALSQKGLELGATALRRGYHHGNDLEARSDLALMSLLGGLSLANAKLGAVHGFAGPIGGMFPAPHGAVCARLLPLVAETNIAALRARAPGHRSLARYRQAARILTGDSNAEAEALSAWLERLVEELGVPRLGAYGLSAPSVPALVTKAQAASSMQGNPIVLSVAELTEILEAAI
jgi:alcohol dehydrogenase class IV